MIDSRKTKLFLTVLYIVTEQTASKPHSHKVAAGWFNDSSHFMKWKGSGLSIIGLTYGSIIIHSFIHLVLAEPTRQIRNRTKIIKPLDSAYRPFFYNTNKAYVEDVWTMSLLLMKDEKAEWTIKWKLIVYLVLFVTRILKLEGKCLWR